MLMPSTTKTGKYHMSCALSRVSCEVQTEKFKSCTVPLILSFENAIICAENKVT